MAYCTSFSRLFVTGWFPQAGCYQCVTKVSQEGHVTHMISQGTVVLHIPFCIIQDEMLQAYQQVNDISLQKIEI